ncbi:MAG: hypothetical protein QY309_05640 [Cyclobacteriaceae bacterium]|nr:MAG: hypothetical protein QY309_05640 [Cyclobacteriaceae bacterium]
MKERIIFAVELLPIIGCSLFPLFFDLSYQINLYMIWEGAYRLYLGELPYRDFGIPMGFCSWLIPALFFKLFGPTLFTLAKAHAFMNIISGLSFRWILVSNGATLYTRLLAIFIFSLTFILGLYWPQYNHTVIIFQLIALGFLFHYLKNVEQRHSWILLIGSGFFFAVAFFTKQDGGALGLLIGLIIIGIHSYLYRTIKPAVVFSLTLLFFFFLFIVPFLQYDFGYWFNYGQPPHYARISLQDILRINMEESRWEKFYLVVIIMILYINWRNGALNRQNLLFTLLVIGIIFQAMIYQVTSYVPKDNNFFFHAFSSAFILIQLQEVKWFQSRITFVVLLTLVSIWWSEKYWKYAEKILAKTILSSTTKNVVSINTYILEPPECNFYSDLSTWKKTTLSSFEGIRMPESTIDGLNRSITLINKIRKEKEPIVLNMSELTPLTIEANFKLEKGPLWYHLGVGMFNQELEMFSTRIEGQYYDVVIFENIPMLNNFYPFSIRDRLKEHYVKVDSFEAPRIVYPGTIEVYLPHKSNFLPVEGAQINH